MKKCIATLLAVICCFCAMPLEIFANEQLNTVENYYEAQLTETQQLFYDAFEGHYIDENGLPKTVETVIEIEMSDMPICQSQEEMNEQMSGYIQEVYKAYVCFVLDYPQVFWTDAFSASYSYYEYSDGSFQVTGLKLTMVNYIEITSEELIAYNTAIEEAVEVISGSLEADADEYDCYKAIHTWVCDTLNYHSDAAEQPEEFPEAYTSYPIFDKEPGATVVCEGYGESYKILCDQLAKQRDVNLQCVLIMGIGVTTKGQENHLWNAVLMPDNSWYGVDTTWDDQNDAIHYEYFLCGKATLGITGHDFENDHIENEQITSNITVEYPEISRYGYGEEQIYDWEYKDGVLTITGEGALPSYLSAEGAPWYEYRNEITSVIIGNGITSVPEGLFRYYQAIEEMSIPFVGANADSNRTYDAVFGHIFGRCASGEGIVQYYGPEGSQVVGYYYAIPSTLKSVKITNDISIPFGAFSNCQNLSSLQLTCVVNSIDEHAFWNTGELTIYGYDNSYVRSYCESHGINYEDLLAYQEGDLNGDASIDIKDVVRMKRILAGKEANVFAPWDLNRDGKVDGVDSTALKEILLGIVVK